MFIAPFWTLGKRYWWYWSGSYRWKVHVLPYFCCGSFCCVSERPLENTPQLRFCVDSNRFLPSFTFLHYPSSWCKSFVFYEPISFLIHCLMFFTNTSGWVPNPNVDLVHAVKNTLDVILRRIPNETCGDMIFSGHTRYCISSLCVISTYLTRFPLKYSLPCYLIALCLALFAMYSFIQVDMMSSCNIDSSALCCGCHFGSVCRYLSLDQCLPGDGHRQIQH